MEQATLRPVPLRPAGPVDPAEALAHVLHALPELDEDAARALSLIEIAGRTRDQAGNETGLEQDGLAAALYRARKALRRSLFPLSASGWCERAERLLSDRIDGVLVPPGPARLDVHLRNCERCVDHERRLSQARERLVRDFIDAHPEAEGAGPAERSVAATLRVVEPATVAEAEPEPEYDGPTRTIPSFGGPAREPITDDAGEPPEPSFAGPGGQVEILVEVEPSIEQDIAPAEPADATPSEDDAEQTEPPVEETEPAAAVEETEPAAAVEETEPAAAVEEPEPAAAVAEPPPAASVIAAQTTLEPASVVWGALTLLSVSLATIALVIVVLALSGIDRIL